MKNTVYNKAYLIEQPKEILVADPSYYNDNSFLNEYYGFQYKETKKTSCCLLTIKNVSNSYIGLPQRGYAEFKLLMSSDLKNIEKYLICDRNIDNKYETTSLHKVNNKFELIIDSKVALFSCCKPKQYGYYISNLKQNDVYLNLFVSLIQTDGKVLNKKLMNLFSIISELDIKEFNNSPMTCISEEFPLLNL